MPSNIFNLNKARKAKARDGKDREAAQNRAKFGRTKIARTRDQDEHERRATLLDGAKLEGGAKSSRDQNDPDEPGSKA